VRAGDRIGHRAWGGNGDCSHSQWCAGDRQLPSECAGGRSLPRGQRGCEGGAGDVASDEDCRQLAAAASEWGGLDILVNNASATKHVANPPPISIRSRGKALYVKSCHTVRFKDMSEAESASLLQYLLAHQQRPEFTCRFSLGGRLTRFLGQSLRPAQPDQRLPRLLPRHAPRNARRRPAALKRLRPLTRLRVGVARRSAFPTLAEWLGQLHCPDFFFAVLPVPIISGVLLRHWKVPLTLLPIDLFVGSRKLALSGMLFALIQPFEILIVSGGDSTHAPNPQTD